MQLVLKAIIPRLDEIGWYVLMAVLTMLAMNITGMLDVLFAASRTDGDIVAYIDGSFVGALRDVTQPLNGRFGNSVIWATMGVLAFCLASVAISEIQDLLDHLDESNESVKSKRASIWLEFLIRGTLRMSALLGIFIWIYGFFAYISPYVSKLLFDSLLISNSYFWGILAFAVGVAIFSACFYVAAVLCRFIVLRVRVFSDQPWSSNNSA